jgi:ElaB/YqjD/DUF883 family membrane-anchored ribosome-binding protein
MYSMAGYPVRAAATHAIMHGQGAGRHPRASAAKPAGFPAIVWHCAAHSLICIKPAAYRMPNMNSTDNPQARKCIMYTDLTRKLIDDYKVLVVDAEELIKATTSQSTEKITDARVRLQHALLELKPRLANTEAVLRDKARVAVSAADEYVHHNPWTALGVATAFGAVVGMLINRR